MDEEIRRHVEQTLAERWPQLDVSVGGARLMEGKGIAIYDLTLVNPRAAGSDDRLLSIEQVTLTCKATAAELVRGALDVRRVEVIHPQVWLRRSAEGRWNYAALLPWKPCNASLPQITIRDGAATIVDETLVNSQPLVLREAMLTAEPSEANGGSTLRIDGSLSGPQMKRLEIHGTYDPSQSYATAAATIDHLKLDEALLAWITPRLPAIAQSAKVTGTICGKASGTWRVGGAEPPAFNATLAISDATASDPRLPRPLTDVAGSIALDATGVQINDLHGKCGEATAACSLNRIGWGPTAPTTIAARIDGAVLDENWYRAIPPLLQREWDKYRPTGTADGTLEATFDGHKWTPKAVLSGRNLAFETDKFPYRLTGGAGTIRFTPADDATAAAVDIDLIGVGGGQPLHVTGRVVDPRPGAAGWIAINGSDLEIDERMIAALQEKPREVVTSLHPTGKFNVAFRYERTQPGDAPHANLQLDLTDVRVNYDKFPYPLRNIQGVVTAFDNEWRFTNLVSSGRRTIRCVGFLQPTADGQGHELSLRFTGEQTPLDEDLFDALPEPVQRAWTQLKPSGKIDLTADVFHRTGQGNPNITASIRARPESTQLRPEFFRYLLERVGGEIVYQDGRLLLKEATAQHNQTTLRTNGEGSFSPDGPWQMKLTGLTVDRLSPQADLTSALPKALGNVIDRLQPTGSFAIHDGVLEFRRGGSEIMPVESQWDLQLDCHQTDLNCGIQLQNIFGTVRLRGKSDGLRAASAGDLALESLSFKDVQFTNVRGPLWLDENQCRLGRLAAQSQQQEQTPQHVTADVYGGTIAGDGLITFEGLPSYRANASIRGADLARLMVERMGGQRDFRGKIDADVELGGEGYKVERLQGKGDVVIREASFYELPVLASMLKLLKTGSKDATAFDESNIRFRLQGKHIYLDKIDFLGDVVNLYGKGYTNFDQQLSLVFSGVVGRRDYSMPLVRNLVRGVDKLGVQLYVDGTLSNPNVTTEAFPGINKVLAQLRTDMQTSTGLGAVRQAERSAATPPTR